MKKDPLARFIHTKCIRMKRIIRRYNQRAIDISYYLDSLRGKGGIEIGGPSQIFRDSLSQFTA